MNHKNNFRASFSGLSLLCLVVIAISLAFGTNLSLRDGWHSIQIAKSLESQGGFVCFGENLRFSELASMSALCRAKVYFGITPITSISFDDVSSEEDLAELLLETTNLRDLSLYGVNVNGELLGSISSLSELRRLDIMRTDSAHKIATVIGSLPELNYVSVFGASVRDSFIDELVKCTKLGCVVLMHTEVTDDKLLEFRLLRPEVEIIRFP